MCRDSSNVSLGLPRACLAQTRVGGGGGGGGVCCSEGAWGSGFQPALPFTCWVTMWLTHFPCWPPASSSYHSPRHNWEIQDNKICKVLSTGALDDWLE